MHVYVCKAYVFHFHLGNEMITSPCVKVSWGLGRNLKPFNLTCTIEDCNLPLFVINGQNML